MNKSDFDSLMEICKSLKQQNKNIKICKSFGIHPWYVNDCKEQLEFLNNLLRDNLIDAVGECGLDFFTDELKASKQKQISVFLSQLELAGEYKKPVVIHGRKCFDELYSYRDNLKCFPAVIFHGWAGTKEQAVKLLENGINAYFSSGKELLRGRKASLECVKTLPAERILLETDAPYMKLKDEEETLPCDIMKVYEAAKKIRPEATFCVPDGLFEN